MKQFFEEEGSAATDALLRRETDAGITLASSALLKVEASRVAIREQESFPDLSFHMTQALEAISLVGMEPEILDEAGRIPHHLKTLDAIHLATAIYLRDRIRYLLSFDDRLIAVARMNGIEARTAG
jgi:predicted nucleic acid-binding protein